MSSPPDGHACPECGYPSSSRQVACSECGATGPRPYRHVHRGVLILTAFPAVVVLAVAGAAEADERLLDVPGSTAMPKDGTTFWLLVAATVLLCLGVWSYGVVSVASASLQRAIPGLSERVRFLRNTARGAFVLGVMWGVTAVLANVSPALGIVNLLVAVVAVPVVLASCVRFIRFVRFAGVALGSEGLAGAARFSGVMWCLTVGVLVVALSDMADRLEHEVRAHVVTVGVISFLATTCHWRMLWMLDRLFRTREREGAFPLGARE